MQNSVPLEGFGHEPIRAPFEWKQCSRCGKWKLRNEYYADSTKPDRLDAACKDCRAAARQSVRVVKTQTRQCSMCKAVKPITEFYVDPRGLNGYRRECKDCKNERRRLRESQPKPQVGSGTKQCSFCGRELPASAFGSHAQAQDRLQPWCRGCMKVYAYGTHAQRAQKAKLAEQLAGIQDQIKAIDAERAETLEQMKQEQRAKYAAKPEPMQESQPAPPVDDGLAGELEAVIELAQSVLAKVKERSG